MSIDAAIQKMTALVKTASPSAEVKVFKVSDEEARLSIYAPAGEMEAVRTATFQPALDLLNSDGLDIQFFIYDKDAPPLKG